MRPEPRKNVIGLRLRRGVQMIGIAEIAARLEDAFRLLRVRVPIGNNESDKHSSWLRPNVSFTCRSFYPLRSRRSKDCGNIPYFANPHHHPLPQPIRRTPNTQTPTI